MSKHKSENEYRVFWEIDVRAATMKEAAIQALNIQRDPMSSAVVFGVLLLGKRSTGEVFSIDLEDEEVNHEVSV